MNLVSNSFVILIWCLTAIMIKLSPKEFRWSFILISFALAIIGITNQINKYKPKKDEIVFVELPSKIVTLNSIPSIDKSSQDEIPKGSLILEINKKPVHDTSEIRTYLNSLETTILIKFYDCKKNLFRSLVVGKEQIILSNLNQLNSSVLVYRFEKKERANLTALNSGDIILKINGKKFSNASDAELLISSTSPELPVLYQILRCGETLNLSIPQNKYVIDSFTLLRFFVCIIFFVFGFLIGFKYAKHFPVRLLALSFVFLSLVFLGFEQSIKESEFLSKFWTLIVAFSFIFGIALLSHFWLYFPVRQSKVLSIHWVVPLNYILSALIFFLLVIYIIKSKFSFNPPLIRFAFIPTLLYHFSIRFLFRHFFEKDLRKINPVFFLILILSIILILLFPIELQLLKFKLLTFLFFLLFAVVPFILFYYLQKYRYYEIRTPISRNYFYIFSKFFCDIFVLAIIVILLYLAANLTIKFPNLHLAGTTIEVLNRPLPPERNLKYEKFAIAIGFSCSVILVIIARKAIIKYLQKKFFHTSFDYRKTAAELSELIVGNIELSELAKNVIDHLEKTLFLKNAGLVIFKDNKIYCQEYFGEIDNDFEEEILQSNELFNLLINTNNQFVHIENLPNSLKNILLQNNLNLVFPVRHQEKLVGALFVGEKLSETKFKSEDYEFLDIISKNIAIAIVNSFFAEEIALRERYKQEIEIAQKIQIASLPKEMPSLEGLEISAVTIPAMEVGGDFYDFLKCGKDALRVVVGDVSGKGTSAALYMSQVQGILRTLSIFEFTLEELLSKTNELLLKSIERGYFISAVACHFDLQNSMVTIARAGHPAMYYYNSMLRKATKIAPKGIALGIVNPHKFKKNLEVVSFQFYPGDTFIFVSDGVIEKILEGKVELSENKILEVLTKYHNLSANEIKERILTEICFANQSSTIMDDITILVVKPK